MNQTAFIDLPPSAFWYQWPRHAWTLGTLFYNNSYWEVMHTIEHQHSWAQSSILFFTLLHGYMKLLGEVIRWGTISMLMTLRINVLYSSSSRSNWYLWTLPNFTNGLDKESKLKLNPERVESLLVMGKKFDWGIKFKVMTGWDCTSPERASSDSGILFDLPTPPPAAFNKFTSTDCTPTASVQLWTLFELALHGDYYPYFGFKLFWLLEYNLYGAILEQWWNSSGYGNKQQRQVRWANISS